MNLIIREARIVDHKSAFNNKIIDLVIEDGMLTTIGTSLKSTENFQEIQLPNLHVSTGWFDSSVSFGEPGYEERETLANGLSVAARSGFTAVALQPNSNPVIDNQSQVNFVRNKANGSATQLFPVGALTQGSAGKDLAELYDMKMAGAVAFGDYKRNLDNANMLKIALQYTQDFDGLVLAFSEDQSIKGNGIANEGSVATRLGLKPIAALAEELQVARNLHILEYTGGKLHLPTISTEKSVDLIRNAKAKGLNVTCSVAVHNLVLTDESLDGFDTRFKVSPPLRSEEDRQALLEGVKEGTIDMITSDHNPIDIEHKKMEFELAKSGTIGLESAFIVLSTVLPIEVIVSKLTAGRTVFGLSQSTIEEGAVANLTFFNPDGNGIFKKDKILSKSRNSAFLRIPTKGVVYGCYNQKILVLNDAQ